MASDSNTHPIKLADLRAVINKIFDHLEFDANVHSLDIWDNYYYEISIDDAFKDIGAPPSADEIGIGDLIEDWEFLSPLIKEDREMAISLMFIHVAPLLKAIAHRVGR